VIAPRYLVPNAVTLANIGCGFAAMVSAAAGEAATSIRLLVVAILLDLTDGQLARALRATSKFGQELDSFCDALSFGAAPAFLVYQVCLAPLAGWGLAVALVYLLAAVLRLARFNLTTDAHVKEARTCGMPTPIGAGYLMALALMWEPTRALVGERGAQGIAVALVLVVAAAMLSRLALPQLKGRGPVQAMLLVGIVNYVVMVAWPTWYAVGWWAFWTGCILLANWRVERRLARGNGALAGALPREGTVR
jgi:CDP-diacylglycerol--serine O-phosphatidyltransferase